VSRGLGVFVVASLAAILAVALVVTSDAQKRSDARALASYTDGRSSGFCEALTGAQRCAYAVLPACDAEDYPSRLPCTRATRGGRILIYLAWQCPADVVWPSGVECRYGKER